MQECNEFERLFSKTFKALNSAFNVLYVLLFALVKS